MPQGGTVVNAENQFVADVIVKDGLVESVGKNIKVRFYVDHP